MLSAGVFPPAVMAKKFRAQNHFYSLHAPGFVVRNLHNDRGKRGVRRRDFIFISLFEL